jgi:hypothetical protein
MITLTCDTEVENLPDGSLITWLRIPGDETSRAVAFVRQEVQPCSGTAACKFNECLCETITWVSPGGWQPMSVRQAAIIYPVHVISLGDIDLGDNTHNDPTHKAGPNPDAEQLTPPTGYCEMPSPSEYNKALTSYTLESGGTWSRQQALECAARVWSGRHDVAYSSVLGTAEAFETWLDRPAKDETAPTLGTMAQVLTRWRELGVTLEALYYVIREQVWFDMHTGKDPLSDIDRLTRLIGDMEWAAEHHGAISQTFILEGDIGYVRDYLQRLTGEDGER